MTEKIDFVEFAELCSQWHGGQESMMYAIASTGSLSFGKYRPHGCEDDEIWMIRLLTNLKNEIKHCLPHAENDDIKSLKSFQRFVKQQIRKLE